MLGGYYPGQLYLGLSGWISAGVLTVQDALHAHYADNIIIIQQQNLVISNALHNHFADNLVLSEGKLLLINNSNHTLTSDVISLIINFLLETQNSKHFVSSNDVLKIINWDELGVYYGIYKKDRTESGALTPTEIAESLRYKPQRGEGDTFNVVELPSDGIYKPDNNNKTGVY